MEVRGRLTADRAAESLDRGMVSRRHADRAAAADVRLADVLRWFDVYRLTPAQPAA